MKKIIGIIMFCVGIMMCGCEAEEGVSFASLLLVQLAGLAMFVCGTWLAGGFKTPEERGEK